MASALPTIEWWWDQYGQFTIRVTLCDGEVYKREFTLKELIEQDRTSDFYVAQRFIRHADVIRNSDYVSSENKYKAIAVWYALAIEKLFPQLFHDSRLPA